MTLLKRQPLLACLACLALAAVAYFLVQSVQKKEASPADSVANADTKRDSAPLAPRNLHNLSTKSGQEKSSSGKKVEEVVREGGLVERVTCEHCGGNHRVHREVSESLRKSLSRSTSHLREVQLEGGGIAIDLGGGFHHASTASVNADGEIEIHCSTSIEEILTDPSKNNSTGRENPPVVENTVR